MRHSPSWILNFILCYSISLIRNHTSSPLHYHRLLEFASLRTIAYIILPIYAEGAYVCVYKFLDILANHLLHVRKPYLAPCCASKLLQASIPN